MRVSAAFLTGAVVRLRVGPAEAKRKALTMARNDEQALIQQVAAGDRQAFQEVYEKFRPAVARFVTRLMGRTDLVEEVVNDTMVIVWQKADRFRGESRLSSWILGIAYRTALKRLRRMSRRPEEELTEDVLPVDHDGPDQHLAEQQSRNRVRRAVARLSPEHRAVVQLTFFQGLSYREIGSVLGCPENTVKTRMYHARRRLRKLLATIDPDPVGTRRTHDET